MTSRKFVKTFMVDNMGFFSNISNVYIVISRFLDAHKIQYLTNYLQALHTDGKGLANEDHTILLLNCYTKLKNTKELDEFILKGEN